jgi:hypothetical protein
MPQLALEEILAQLLIMSLASSLLDPVISVSCSRHFAWLSLYSRHCHNIMIHSITITFTEEKTDEEAAYLVDILCILQKNGSSINEILIHYQITPPSPPHTNALFNIIADLRVPTVTLKDCWGIDKSV